MPGSGKEAAAIRRILVDQPEHRRLFRINAGMGWAGRVVRHEGHAMVLADPRALHAAPKGWPDLCGWETIEITPEMVGQKIAVFVGLEVKATGKLSKDQRRFREILERMGGKFIVDEPAAEDKTAQKT